LIGYREIEVQHALAGFERRRGHTVDVDFGVLVDRERAGQKACKKRHRTAHLGRQRLIDHADHFADRAIFSIHLFHDLLAHLCARGLCQRPRECEKQQCHERAGQGGKPCADAETARAQYVHE
jgi:hypothetical protein